MKNSIKSMIVSGTRFVGSIAVACLFAMLLTSCEEIWGGGDDDEQVAQVAAETNSPPVDSTSTKGDNKTTTSSKEDTETTLVQTGIVPEDGDYSFSANGDFSVSGSVISFSAEGYSYYSIPVSNGSFSYQNGYVYGSSHGSDSGKEFPTDGFVIWGNFNSPTSASGTIQYVFNGVVQSTSSFTASM